MAIAKRSRTELATQRFEYAPAPESTDHVKIEKRYDLVIGGRMVKAHSQKRFPTINPSNEEKLSEVVEADEVDVDRAVKAASKAFDSWSRIGASRRARYLFRISRILQERARELAVVETMDGGKPIKESRDVDIPLSAAHFFYYAGWADKLEWAFPNVKPRPIGVAGGHGQAPDPGARWQGGQHRVRGRATGRRGRGHRQRHLFQPGPCVLRGQPAPGAGVDLRAPAGEAEDPPRNAAPGRPAGQEH